MKAKNGSNICDPKLVKHQYEMLRANALGNMNRASEFTMFLRNGMSAWMRAIGEKDSDPRKIRQQTSYAFTELNIPDAGLASILTDAILNAARPARHFRGST
ncbi:hypothetical protein ACFL0M_14110 [Thermodesulfobacteriota bacterium]